MQNPLLNSRITAHRKRKYATGFGKTPGPLQKRPSEGVGFRELPKCGPFFGCSPVSFMHHHMKLPKEIMRQDCGHHIKVIAMEPSDGNVIQIALRFQFTESIFLRPSAIVKIQDLLHGRLLVRNDHFELIAVVVGNEDIKLDRFLRLLFDLSPNKEKSEASVPAFGFPRCIKIRKLIIEAPPTSPALNHLLKLSKPLKGHRDSELNTIVLKRSDHLITKEGAVHAHLYDDAGAGSANNADALHHEFESAIRVMNIAGTRQNVKHLPCLGDSAEQMIIAPLSLLLLVKANRCAFGHTARAYDRPVKIKGHSGQSKGLKSCNKHLTARLPNLDYAFVVNTGQGPADSGDVRKFSQSQKTKHHEVVPIVVHIPKSPIPQHQMHYQHKSNSMMAEYRAGWQMIKTGSEPRFDFKFRKQFMNDHQSRKGRESLILETKFRNTVDTGENLCFTRFHYQWPPALVDFASLNVNFNQSGGRFTRV